MSVFVFVHCMCLGVINKLFLDSVNEFVCNVHCAKTNKKMNVAKNEQQKLTTRIEISCFKRNTVRFMSKFLIQILNKA